MGSIFSKKKKLDNLSKLHKSSSATIIFPQVGIYLDVYQDDFQRAEYTLEDIHV
jgi:hypothetical protein